VTSGQFIQFKLQLWARRQGIQLRPFADVVSAPRSKNTHARGRLMPWSLPSRVRMNTRVRMNLTRGAERRTSMNRPRDLTRGDLRMRSPPGLDRASSMSGSGGCAHDRSSTEWPTCLGCKLPRRLVLALARTRVIPRSWMPGLLAPAWGRAFGVCVRPTPLLTPPRFRSWARRRPRRRTLVRASLRWRMSRHD